MLERLPKTLSKLFGKYENVFSLVYTSKQVKQNLRPSHIGLGTAHSALLYSKGLKGALRDSAAVSTQSPSIHSPLHVDQDGAPTVLLHYANDPHLARSKGNVLV